MIEFGGRVYVYIDAKALQDNYMKDLIEYFAERHKTMMLCVNNVWEQKELERLDAYEYICDTFIGTTMPQLVTEHMTKKKAKERMVIVVGYEDLSAFQDTKIACIQLGEDSKYTNVGDFLDQYNASQKRSRWLLYGIMLTCIVYFLTYFFLLDNMPTFMVEGPISFLFALIPMAIFIFTYVKACKKGLASGWNVVDLITDFIG